MDKACTKQTNKQTNKLSYIAVNSCFEFHIKQQNILNIKITFPFFKNMISKK